MPLKDILKPQAPTLAPDDPAAVAGELAALTGAEIYAGSVTLAGENAFFMARRGGQKVIGVAYSGAQTDAARTLDGESAASGGLGCRLAPADLKAASFLREELPFLKPVLVGLATSLGLGDRLGIATPGHVRSVKGTGLAPYFCQQSIREMTRTGRSPQEVQATASLGAFEAGWRGGYGSDADHLKTSGDVDRCLEAGFTMFTFDPGDHVDDEADGLSGAKLRARFEKLPWSDLETSAADCRKRYAGRSVDLGDGEKLTFDDAVLARAAVKYGRAAAHVAGLYRYLVEKAGKDNVEVEVSVDETNSPTSVAEHYYVASELARLGVEWVSLAPRFVGRFEKGVDYIGDIEELRKTLRGHAAVARQLGPYKLSIHSGSDKFAVYPLAAEAAGGLVHVKTAGTSYLEALRTLAAGADRELFREILAFARERYEEDKATYHVSADLTKAFEPGALADDGLAGALDQFDTRQVLHVTFGSVLNEKSASGELLFKPRLMRALDENEELHYEIVAKHLARHAAPFAKK